MLDVTDRVVFSREPPIAGEFPIKLLARNQIELDIAFKSQESKSIATLDVQTEGMDEWAHEFHALKLVFNMNAMMPSGTISG